LKFEQLIYTSAKRGMGNGPGFQVYAKSEGISSSEVTEIQNLVGYIPPSTLPSRPTEDEVSSLFPKSFTFFQLSTGRFGIFQTSYIGKDYSERYGNYLSHVLISAGDFLPDYPIKFYGSSIFKTRLGEEEESGEEVPAPLRPLETIPFNPEISFTRVAEFLEKNDRYEHLKAMLSVIISNEVPGKRLMIIDEDEKLPYWYAAIQFSLPKHLAHRITFTTYTHNPDKNSALLCSTWLSGTRFIPAPANSHSYYLFDFISSNIYQTESASCYADFAVKEWRKGSSLQQLFDLIGKSNIKGITKDLDKCVAVLALIQQGISGAGNSGIGEIFDFVREMGSGILYSEVLTAMDEYWSNQVNWDEDILKVSIDDAAKISAFLLEGANHTSQDNHFSIAWRFFFETVDQLMLDAAMPDEVYRVSDYYRDIKKQFDSVAFLETSISSRRLAKLEYLRTEPNLYKLKFYFIELIHSIHLIHKQVSIPLSRDIKAILQMMFGLLMKDLSIDKKEIFKIVYQEPNLLAELITEYYKTSCQSVPDLKGNLQIEFHHFLSQKNEEENLQLYAALAKTELGRQLAKVHFYHKVHQSENPANEVDKLYKTVIERNIVLADSMTALMEVTIKKIQEKGQLEKQLPVLLNATYLSYLKTDSLKQIIEGYLASMDLSELNDQKKEFLRNLSTLSEDKSIQKMTDDILLLANIGEAIKNGKTFNPELQGKVNQRIAKLAPHQYKSYLDGTLTECLPAKLKESRRVEIISIFFVAENSYLFWDSIAGLYLNQKKEYLPNLLAFLVYSLSKTRAESQAEAYRKLDTEIILFFKQNKSDYKKLNELVLGHPQFKNSLVLKKRWENIREDISSKEGASKVKGGLFSKLKNRLF
jgi:hypothetical protein